jgi:hypothetical protein
VFRSPAQSELRPVATRASDGTIRVEWPAVEHAARYVVTVFASDGARVLEREVTEPLAVIDAAAVAEHRGERRFARVDAFDATGVRLGSSARFELPLSEAGRR